MNNTGLWNILQQFVDQSGNVVYNNDGNTYNQTAFKSGMYCVIGFTMMAMAGTISTSTGTCVSVSLSLCLCASSSTSLNVSHPLSHPLLLLLHPLGVNPPGATVGAPSPQRRANITETNLSSAKEDKFALNLNSEPVDPTQRNGLTAPLLDNSGNSSSDV
jgi:hypothetical protein